MRKAFSCIIASLVSYNISIMNLLKRYIIKGIIFVIILGTISHFIYGFSGNNFFLGFFFPVNESIWEHMKLCFFPMLLYAVYMNQKLKHAYPTVTPALLLGVLLGTLCIPVIFYTYTGILGTHYLVLDMATFFLSVLLAFAAVYHFSQSRRPSRCTFALASAVCILAICFFVFTYLPPGIGLFAVPTG